MSAADIIFLDMMSMPQDGIGREVGRQLAAVHGLMHDKTYEGKIAVLCRSSTIAGITAALQKAKYVGFDKPYSINVQAQSLSLHQRVEGVQEWGVHPTLRRDASEQKHMDHLALDQGLIITAVRGDVLAAQHKFAPQGHLLVTLTVLPHLSCSITSQTLAYTNACYQVGTPRGTSTSGCAATIPSLLGATASRTSSPAICLDIGPEGPSSPKFLHWRTSSGGILVPEPLLYTCCLPWMKARQRPSDWWRSSWAGTSTC